MNTLLRRLVWLVTMPALLAAAPAAKSAPREQLKNLVEQLQKSPADAALREQIIKLSKLVKPPPPIPEAARRHHVMARTLLKEAKQPEEFAEAIGEFKSALLAAPWWGEAYNDLGQALGSVGRYEEAIGALNLYVATMPGGERARLAQDEIYTLEAKQKKALKEEETRKLAAAREEEARAQARAEAERAARAEAERHQQTRAVVARFKQIVAGRVYDRLAANWEKPNYKVVYTMTGVNEREYSGSVWYNWGNACQKFVYEEERILSCFITDEGRTLTEAPSYVGTPHGPNLEDIVWEIPDIKYENGSSSWDGRTMKKRVWAYFNQSTGGITFSGDRPLDSSYDPQSRYSYMWFRPR